VWWYGTITSTSTKTTTESSPCQMIPQTPTFPHHSKVSPTGGSSPSIQVAHVLTFFAGRFSYLARKPLSKTKTFTPSSRPLSYISATANKRLATADSRTKTRIIRASAQQHLLNSASSGQGSVSHESSVRARRGPAGRKGWGTCLFCSQRTG